MSMDDVIAEGELGDLDDSTTIRDLRDLFGNAAVNRGIKYMASLSDANEKYKQKLSEEEYKRGMEDAGVSEESLESETGKRLIDKWQKESVKNGLGIDE